jgi:hypothetical protein
MSALTFLDITPKFNTIMFVMFTDAELFLTFGTVWFTFTEILYGQEKLR